MKDRILFISTTFFPTFAGTEVEIYNLATSLSNNYDVTLLIPSYCRKFNSNKSYDFKLVYFNSFFLKIFSKRPSKIICKIYGLIHGRKLRRQFKDHVKFVFFVHPTLNFFSETFENIDFIVPQGVDVQIDSNSSYGFSRDPRIKTFMQSSVEKFNPNILYMSESMKISIHQLFGGNKHLFYVPTGTHVDLIANYKINRKKVAAKYQVNSNQTILLTAARYNKKKGFDKVQAICEQLINTKLDFKWILIGQNVKLLSQELTENVKEKLIFLDPFGYDSENLVFPPIKLIELYKLADVFCNMSYVEGFSLTNLDVLASGTPIVAFNSPGLNDILNDENSYIASSMDTNDFANKILIAVKEKGTKKEGAYNSVKDYSWDIINIKYDNLIQISRKKLNVN